MKTSHSAGIGHGLAFAETNPHSCGMRRPGAHRVREAVDRAAELFEFALAARNGIVFSGAATDGRKAIALTFDDGPSTANTPPLLDLLREFDARATFFVVGREIEGREGIIARIAAEGHELGNHTYNHPHTVSLGTRELREELERTNQILSRIDGVPPVRVVRPPYGKDRRRIDSIGRDLGMRTILWSIDSGDTRLRRRLPEQLAEQIIRKVNPGSIILLHDGGDARPATLGACRTLLSSLGERGFRFLTVSGLLETKQTAPFT